MTRFWTRSLTGQMVALLLLALVLSHVIGFVIYRDERTQVLRGALKEEFLARTAAVTRLLDATPSDLRARAIIDKASTTFPQMRRHLDMAQARIWAGLRPVTPSGTPIIEETPIAGLWVNSGHGHLGWTLACGSGRLIAERICRQGVGTRSALPPSGN